MQHDGLRNLARLYGVQVDYRDAEGQLRAASTESLWRVLQALGAPLEGRADVAQALRARRLELWQQVTEPVVVAWERAVPSICLRLPASKAQAPYRCELRLEDGQTRRWSGRLLDVPVRQRREVDGRPYVTKCLCLPESLPWGYHRLLVEVAEVCHETVVIAAPTKLLGADTSSPPAWGLFAPLYALHGRTSWGAGDMGDLQAFMQWTAAAGGAFVATLPLLASVGDMGDDASPYAPSSRVFWNEFYINIERCAQDVGCGEALGQLIRPGVQKGIESLRRQPLVDYQRQMALKREVLMGLSDAFFERGPAGGRSWRIFCEQSAQYQAYARFRAAGQRQGRAWRHWPSPLRGGDIGPADFDERIYRYHLFAQWQIQAQIGWVSDWARRNDLRWYLDLALGVHRDGYDVWRQQELFVPDVCVGAPPDPFFPGGQSWGFPPLHPQRLRRQGHAYWIETLRHQLGVAQMLRVDHVMGLHRLYWIPDGLAPNDGVYVRYPAEELFAVLSLESQRRGVHVVGENLGTVPPAVDRHMQRHGMAGMYTLQFQFTPDEREPFRPIPQRTVASLNTHDMPPFAAFWTDLDIEDRRQLGFLDDQAAGQQRRSRDGLRVALLSYLRDQGLLDRDRPDVQQVIEACLKLLGSSSAQWVQVNLEDLWAETEPQNTPGTSQERINWRRRARFDIETFSQDGRVMQVLSALGKARRKN